jgi:hypothetical protein
MPVSEASYKVNYSLEAPDELKTLKLQTSPIKNLELDKNSPQHDETAVKIKSKAVAKINP